MIIRISTERKNIRWLCELIGEFYPCFTIYKTIGFWRGKREKSVVLEIDTVDFNHTQNLLLDLNIKIICRKICGYNRQDCVLVQKIESETILL
jgi:hypothetical protein